VLDGILVAVVLRRLQRLVPNEKIKVVNAAFLVATEPDDAEPTLSSTAMQEGITKDGSALPA